MGKNKRRNFSSEFKAKVAIEAIKEKQTLSELAIKYELHPTQISEWKNRTTDAVIFGRSKLSI